MRSLYALAASLTVGSFALDIPAVPYFSGSRIPITAKGFYGTLGAQALGGGRVDGLTYVAPRVLRPRSVTLVAGGNGAIALASLRIVPPPVPTQPLVAVASYVNGIALHDPQTFALLGIMPVPGAAGDVAFKSNGDIVSPDTDGDTLSSIARTPWRQSEVPGVAQGNEVLVDAATGDVFVSDRDVLGDGALTRITPAGSVTRVRTGVTAEGLAIDEARQIVYVGNVNDPSVLAVDARTMRPIRRIASVNRTFGIALDPRNQRLFVVSNASKSMPGGAGYVAAIDLRPARARIVQRSARMTFPLGAALDAGRQTLFVTDEGANVVYVLDAGTLAPRRPPLRTCRVPWRPHYDAGSDLLYVPCARSNAVDVFSGNSLRRVSGSPFRTGGFPISVATWRG